MSHFNPGLVKFHPVENEKYMIRDRQKIPARSLATPEPIPLFKPSSHKWRNYWLKNDQEATPRCTSFGTMTDLACRPITYKGRNPLKDPQVFYEEIQAYDRSQGRHYAEGATTDAAMQCARANGWITAWYWGYTLDTAHRTIATKPIVAGTNWYSSMFDGDNEGIIRITPTASLAGGHLFCLNGYNARRGLWRIAQTWGNGVQWLPDEDFLRLIREDGEFTLIEETG